MNTELEFFNPMFAIAARVEHRIGRKVVVAANPNWSVQIED